MASLADQVADLVALARETRLEIEAQALACRQRRDRRPLGTGVPILYFYASIFNGTVNVLSNAPVFRDRGTGSGLGPGLSRPND